MPQTRVEQMIRNNFAYRRDPETLKLLDVYTELSQETQEQISADVLLLKRKLRIPDDKKVLRNASIQTSFEVVMKTWLFVARNA